MDKQTIKELLKQMWYYISAYFTHYLLPILMDTLNQTKNYFIELLWASVKDEFTRATKSAVKFIERFFDSPSYKEKEEAVIDVLFQNVDLPLVLKPFKPLLKKIFRNKVRRLVEKNLKKFKF